MCSDLPMSGKKGPIYSVEWNPNSEEFCVVYGCILVLDVQGYLYHDSKFEVLTLQYLAMEAGSLCDKCLIRSA